jgi:hypothetical protein
MPRCVICDYTHEDGSPLLDKAPNSRTVVSWHSRYGDFLCTDCAKSIKFARQDFAFNSP